MFSLLELLMGCSEGVKVTLTVATSLSLLSLLNVRMFNDGNSPQ